MVVIKAFESANLNCGIHLEDTAAEPAGVGDRPCQVPEQLPSGDCDISGQATSVPMAAEPPSPELTSHPSWSDVVERIRNDDPSGMAELYQTLSTGVRFFLYRQLGSRDLDDKVHTVFVIIAEAIKAGKLREPERLMGFVRTIVRRQVAGHIGNAVQERRSRTGLEATLVLADRHPDPESGAIELQQNEIARRILRSINTRDREVLIRFYLTEETPETICREMGLTETQFRLIKSRAKNRFTEICKARFRVLPRKSMGWHAHDSERVFSA